MKILEEMLGKFLKLEWMICSLYFFFFECLNILLEDESVVDCYFSLVK